MAESRLNTNSTSAKVAVAILIAALVVGGFYMGVYQDLSNKVDGAASQTTALQADLQRLRGARVAYLADKQKLNEKQLQQKDFNRALPELTESASFLSAVQQVANVSGVDLKSYTPVDEVPQSFYSKIPMKLELRGKFLQIAKFTYELGRVERIINVENIELQQPKSEGEDVVLTAKCLATAFRMNGKGAAVPGVPGGAAASAPSAPLPPGPGAKP